MNYSILNQYGVSFQKQSNGNIKIKAYSRNLENFMYMLCRDEIKLQKLIFTLNQVLSNGINTISEDDKFWDVEIGEQVYSGEIFSDSEFDLYFEDESNETFPLNDIKEILESLIEFIRN